MARLGPEVHSQCSTTPASNHGWDINNSSVKQLDKATLEMIPLCDDILHLSTALQAIGKHYDSSNESTDFKKLLDEHISQLEADSPCVPENHVFYKQFKEAVWRVRHADEPMPGEEHEEIIMTGSQCNLVNTSCPLTGKPVTELKDPVRRYGWCLGYFRNTQFVM